MQFLSKLTRGCVFSSLQSVYELKLPFHYPGLQVDGCPRGRGYDCRCMCTAKIRLLLAARSCTRTSVPSLVNGNFEMSQNSSFSSGKND